MMADNVHTQCLAWSTHPHFDCGVESGCIKMHTFQLWKIESWPHGMVCEIQGKRNERKDLHCNVIWVQANRNDTCSCLQNKAGRPPEVSLPFVYHFHGLLVAGTMTNDSSSHVLITRGRKNKGRVQESC